MKEIKVIIDDTVFGEIMSEILGKGITANLFTMSDAFVLKVVKAIKAGDKSLTLVRKINEKR